MEALEKTYRDISTMRMKYDHLCAVCNSLLKNWPHRDFAGKLLSKDEQPGQPNREQEPLFGEVAVVDKALEEMQLLEDILQKAKRVRSTSPPHKTKSAALESKSSSSMTSRNQLTENVYTQPPFKVSKPSKQPNLKHGFKSSRPKSGLKISGVQQPKKSASTGKAAIKTARHLAGAVENFVGSEREKVVPISAKVYRGDDMCGRSVNPDSGEKQKEVEPELEDTFNIQQNGCNLSMPGRYYRVQHALSKLREEELGQKFSPIGGKHFCRRLVSQGEPCSVPALQKLLLVEELTWLKEKLLSLTSYELTVSERSSWKEVWQIKTKLEALTEHAQKVRDDQICTRTESTSVEKERREGLIPPKTPNPIAYTSLEEWQSMATLELELKLGRMELELLQYVDRELLPLLPVTNCPTHLIQTVYELIGLTKPIYVKVSENK